MSLTFDGTSDYIDVLNAGAITTAFSTMFWCKPGTQLDGFSSPVGIQDTTFGIMVVNWGETDYRMFNNGVWGWGNVTNLAYDIGNWQHVAATWSTSTGDFRWYINGVDSFLTTGQATSQTGIGSTSSVKIGAIATASKVGAINWEFKGDLAEVSVWDKELSEREVQYYMHKQLTGAEANLMGYWPIDDAGIGTAVTIKNKVNGGNAGAMNTFSGNPWAGQPPVRR